MKRIETSGEIAAPHFIGAWTIEPSEICDDLIEFFEKHTAKQKQGEFSSGVDPLLKTVSYTHLTLPTTPYV